MGYNAANDSLFIGGHPYDVSIAEVSIPRPVNTDDVSSMAFADVLQEFADPTEGSIWDLSPDDGAVLLGGLLVDNGQLFGTAYVYYDANGVQQASHYSRSLNLNESSVTPFYSVWDPNQTGFVSGYLAAVPPSWVGDLGGPAVTGQCCIPIVSRTSWGPDAISWNPSDLSGGRNPVPAAPLMYYNQDHDTLGPWEGSNAIYGGATTMGGLALVDGTRTALYVGVNGTGDFCYGPGTDDESLAGTPADDDGEYFYCYDPMSFDQGVHAYPYTFQFWAFDMNDWAAVQAGTKDPWDIMPYGVWPFELPTGEPFRIGGVAYDARNQRLFVSEYFGDVDGYSYRPLIHVFQIQ
jgi:hypothetical protein